MLNLRHLETMIITAEAGSFRKAAERMYVTPSAVIKQIDALEEEVGTVLFERTSRGLQLTAAGHSLYTDGKLLMEYAEKSIDRARSSADDESNVLRVATSPVTSADLITDYWVRIYEQWPQLKIQIIPFQNTPSDINRVFAGLGTEIDMLTGICDDTHYTYRNWQEWEEKMARYSTLWAEEAYHKGRRASLPEALLHGIGSLFSTLLLRLGFLDGWMGICLCCMYFSYTMLKYLKLYGLQSNRKD